MGLSRYTLNLKSSVKAALEKINTLTDVQTIFVIDDNFKVIGSITDGDIRRGFINGLSINDKLENFLHKDFKYLKQNNTNYLKLKEFKKKGIKILPFLDSNNKLIEVIDLSKTKSILPIDAVIMAGGKGTRLRPLTLDTPKPLLKIGNKEIISYNFDRLLQFGIRNQNITVNYLGNQIRDFCNNYNKQINFNIVEEETFMGTAGALSLINNFKNDTILLTNSDILTDIDYEDLYISFINSNSDFTVVSTAYDITLPYAILEVDEKKVLDFKEKPTYTYYANAGIYLMKKDVLEMIPKNEHFNATDLMNAVLNNNMKLNHYHIRSYWLDIGKHEDFSKAQKDVKHINFN